MSFAAQAEKAHKLQALHLGPRILVLPNVWDVASARIVEDAGFPAIATSSAGVANSLGYPDGQKISRDEMLEVVARIARVVSVPVTADMEAGYGKTPEDLAQTAVAIVEAGAVGCNIEDCVQEGSRELFPIQLQKQKIRAMVDAAKKLGAHLVINARTDIFLEEVGDPAMRIERTAERLNAYREAGAESLFAPGVKDADTIGKLVRAVKGPLNILGGAGTPSVAELEKLGVARVSLGSGPMRASMGLTSRIAKHIRDNGTFEIMTEGAMPYVEANRLLEKH
ncbi:MAG TPA: isocitrate lyase/phosphoenolpyruvate mutase family protein [Candidatus Acidoferrales bacterium]|nr:isocitrate lyase/phosphoenolpyruvate mutase family protein [Candidatus Acidoferrales bacterium]